MFECHYVLSGLQETYSQHVVNIHRIEEFAVTTVDYNNINEVIYFIPCTSFIPGAVFERTDRVLDYVCVK
jgi:hypothetical protein